MDKTPGNYQFSFDTKQMGAEKEFKGGGESNTILPWGQVEIKLFASVLRNVDRFQHPEGRSGRQWI